MTYQYRPGTNPYYDRKAAEFQPGTDYYAQKTAEYQPKASYHAAEEKLSLIAHLWADSPVVAAIVVFCICFFFLLVFCILVVAISPASSSRHPGSAKNKNKKSSRWAGVSWPEILFILKSLLTVHNMLHCAVSLVSSFFAGPAAGFLSNTTTASLFVPLVCGWVLAVLTKPEAGPVLVYWIKRSLCLQQPRFPRHCRSPMGAETGPYWLTVRFLRRHSWEIAVRYFLVLVGVGMARPAVGFSTMRLLMKLYLGCVAVVAIWNLREILWAVLRDVGRKARQVLVMPVRDWRAVTWYLLSGRWVVFLTWNILRILFWYWVLSRTVGFLWEIRSKGGPVRSVVMAWEDVQDQVLDAVDASPLMQWVWQRAWEFTKECLFLMESPPDQIVKAGWSFSLVNTQALSNDWDEGWTSW